jgi:iron(III) transport system substrate-binding protein
MTPLGFLMAITFLLLLGVPPSGSVSATTLEELVAAAKQEGVVDLYAPSSLTPLGAKALGAAFNKKYDIEIRLNYNPGSSFTRDVGKVVGLAATGVSPEWDLMVIHDAGHATLWLRKLHKPFDYVGLGVNPELIHFDKGAVSFANQFALPAYNRKAVSPEDAPKSWEDLLDPKWKGGRLGMSTAVHHLARLATHWGEEKTTRFVKALAEQKPILGRLATITTRLQLGEVDVAITLIDAFVRRANAKHKEEIVVFAKGVEPVISPSYLSGVLKGGPHPNAAHLFSVFLTTPEAQRIWQKFPGESSAFVPGTRAYEFAQGKKIIYMTQDQAQTVDRLTREYGKVLGFSR